MREREEPCYSLVRAQNILNIDLVSEGALIYNRIEAGV
jgi:hypothetical protein